MTGNGAALLMGVIVFCVGALIVGFTLTAIKLLGYVVAWFPTRFPGELTRWEGQDG